MTILCLIIKNTHALYITANKFLHAVHTNVMRPKSPTQSFCRRRGSERNYKKVINMLVRGNVVLGIWMECV